MGFKVTKQIAIFGSSKVNSRDTLYTRTVKAAASLVEQDYTLATPGGETGISRAVIEGADSVKPGSEIVVPLSIPGQNHGYIALPGGYGTLQKILTVIHLKQTYKLHRPIIVVGPIWRDVLSSVSRTLARNSLIIARDMELWEYAQTPEAAAVKMIEMIS